MELGYGLITCQRHPADSRTAAQVYSDALEVTRACDSAGLDSVWTSEHHFWDDDYMPSLLVMSAAMAAQTSRIKIGTGVLLAPLYHPIRLAEDAATVDLISNGRLILGLGIGWRHEEFERLGIPMEGLGRRMTETVKILRKAWGPSTFEFAGKAFEFAPTNVTPKPTRTIPIWLGAFVDDALKRAGRIADGYLGSSTALDDIPRRLQIVKDALDKAGRDPDAFTVAVHEPVWVSDDPDAELKDALQHLHYIRWKYDDMRHEFARGTEGPLPQPPAMDEARAEFLRSTLIFGTPQQVAERIDEFRKVVGAKLHFVARSYYPGLAQDRALSMVQGLAKVKELLG